jgi:hypothetical protein
MLRITVHNGDGATRFILEGKLMGAWALELESCWRQQSLTTGAPRILVELTDVIFVDDDGRALLKRMAASGAELVAADVVMKAMVEEITEGGRAYEKTD